MAEFFAACHSSIRNDPIHHALHAGESQSPPRSPACNPLQPQNSVWQFPASTSIYPHPL